MKTHAEYRTVTDYPAVHTVQQRSNVTNIQASTSHENSQRSQHLQKCNQNKEERADTDDNYVAQLKLPNVQHQQLDIQKYIKMKTPSATKQQRNPVFSTPNKHVKHLTSSLLEESNIKLLIEQRKMRQARLTKRDAIIAVQMQFFAALRKLYTWPMDSLIMANIIEVRDFWELQLNTARQCSHKAETIDPNHYGNLRYDIMAEIVKLEHSRIDEFLAAFEHYHALMQTGDFTDEFRSDDHMLTFFD